VFEAFYRVEENVTQAGQPSTALGLALTRRLVEAHGGTIRCMSAPGRGTTFRVTLPRLAAAVPTQAAPAAGIAAAART
jgi:two-component system OmpR family sensor kinase